MSNVLLLIWLAAVEEVTEQSSCIKRMRRRRNFTRAIGVLIAAAVCTISTSLALSLTTFSTDASRRNTYSGNTVESIDYLFTQQQTLQHMHVKDHDCNYDCHRRDLLTTLSSFICLSAASPALAAGPEGNDFEAPMNGLTRQIRTSVVKGAQVIDKIDSRWERFSDNFGLGDKRNQPKRNVIDAGGNERSKKVFKSESNNGNVVMDEAFADNLLKRCDEVS
jgi:hypothetical protein